MQKVSIIIPTFNSVKYLQETLDSLSAQDYPYFECIIVDDGSSDQTETIILNHVINDNRFQFYRRPNELPKGPSASRNYGVEKAKGEYVIFLDADDLLSSNCLKNRISEFQINSGCDFLVFQMDRFLDRPDFSKKQNETETDQDLILQSFVNLHGQWPITSPIYRTEFFKKIRFNQNLIVFEDLEVAIKAILFSRNFKVFNTIDCYYRNDQNYKAKFDSIEVKTKMINGFQIFLKSIAAVMQSHTENRFKNKNIRLYLVESYRKLFLSVILNNNKLFRNDNKNILQILSDNKVLTRVELLKMYFSNHVLLPFAAIKGSGVSRLIQILYK